MFRTSQEIRLNADESNQKPNLNKGVEFCGFGKYHKTPDMDKYSTQPSQVFIAPELTDPSRVQLFHFPNGALMVNTDVNFIIKRNGVKGNFEVKLENPFGHLMYVPLRILDPERFEVGFNLNEAGLYKVHIKCNSVSLPKSPFIIVAVKGTELETDNKMALPNFTSDASKVIHRGLGLSHIMLNEKNEFTIDGSAAGNNILFVGIFGPKGQCDEVVVKHMGKDVYKVTYKVEDPGDYLLAAKWGDDHIPGSPFSLTTN
ncbi:filamin-A [Stomoxys calcitrans]|uniref:filamin-A n=1 Tax=Stomoxys calcitrans TaxID=35570 RepID=UPI0027E2F9C0|nr:filamin-A [Stomoxys calcitrans]XP_059218662.1 filamin-A [Stomoxys calcitrans]XP_059218663.1 filamin-A [Stomoxys calcitrans]XP_059218664.1 filamin-A [Stomoxys calcitrans]